MTSCSSQDDFTPSSCSCELRDPPQKGEVLTLLPSERDKLLWTSITTITFYKGSGPTKWLRSRVEALVAANPWLAGRLWTSQVGRIDLLVPDVPQVASCFSEACDSELTPGLPYEDIESRIQGMVVKIGVSCVDVDEPLFRIVLVKVSESDFAIVLSMSHVIGDGHTYYTIYNALGEDATSIPTLDPVRKPDVEEVLLECFDETLKWLKSVRVGCISKMTWGKLMLPPRRIRAWYINSEWVEAQKKKHDKSTGVPYVSTNDVLTSWFLRRGGYDCGIMAIDVRKRLCGLTDSDAGNYFGAMLYSPEMFATPSEIRKPLLNKLQSEQSCSSSISSSLLCNAAGVSNWASFPARLSLPGSQQVIHIPFLGVSPFDQLVIFRPMPDTLAVLISDRLPDDENADPVLGKSIFCSMAREDAFEIVLGICRYSFGLHLVPHPYAISWNGVTSTLTSMDALREIRPESSALILPTY